MSLRTSLEGGSARGSSPQLRELEDDAVVRREVYEVPPRVECSLTVRGLR